MMTVVPMAWKGDRLTRVMIIVQDMGEQHLLQSLANTDGLTGLLNKRYFDRVLTVLEQPVYDLTQLLEQPDPLFLMLENLQDPGNLGTMIRTGEGAGITGVIMNNQTVDIFNPKTIRATMGSIFRVPFVYVPDLAPVLEQMHAKGIYTYAAHLKGQEYYDSFSFREPTAFLIGNEGNGLSKEISDQAGQYLKIPMEGRVESLNASIAAALLMYEAHRQRSARL
jgi:TrmH family RNA methyltransferase